MTLVRYQGPKYQAADNLTEDEEEEDNLKLEAICKEMKHLPQMIENLPEDIEIDGEYEMTNELGPDEMFFNIQTSEMACQTHPSKISQRPKCLTRRMDMWLAIRKRDKKIIKKLKKQLKKSK